MTRKSIRCWQCSEANSIPADQSVRSSYIFYLRVKAMCEYITRGQTSDAERCKMHSLTKSNQTVNEFKKSIHTRAQ